MTTMKLNENQMDKIMGGWRYWCPNPRAENDEQNTDMENKTVELNEEQMEAVRGAGIFDFIEDSFGYIADKTTDTIDKLFGTPQDGCTGKQTVPGFNVIELP